MQVLGFLGVSPQCLWVALESQHKSVIESTLIAVNNYRIVSDKAIESGSHKAVGDRSFAKRFGNVLESIQYLSHVQMTTEERELKLVEVRFDHLCLFVPICVAVALSVCVCLSVCLSLCLYCVLSVLNFRSRKCAVR